MNPFLSRRKMLSALGAGFGSLGMLGVLADEKEAKSGLHFPAKAKHTILLFLPGGPSHMDMFDPKPALQKYAGQRPDAVNVRTERTTGPLMPSPFAFKKYGRGGLDVSELLPKLAGIADELCVVRSMYTFNPTHTPARSLFQTGNIAATRPTMGRNSKRSVFAR